MSAIDTIKAKLEEFKQQIDNHYVEPVELIGQVVNSLLIKLDNKISDQELKRKLALLQSIKFYPTGTGFFAKKVPSKLADIPDTLLTTELLDNKESLSLKYDAKIHQFLEGIQSDLYQVLADRHYHQFELIVTYDQALINQSKIFINYMKTSQSKDYERGSLALDLHRGVKFIEDKKAPVDMRQKILLLKRRLKRDQELKAGQLEDITGYEKQLRHLEKQLQKASYLQAQGKLNAQEVQDLRDGINYLTSLMEITKKQIDYYQADIDLIQPLIDDQYLLVKQMAGNDEKKADVLNRFGHQMLMAEFMHEAGRVLKIRNHEDMTVTPLHEIFQLRAQHVIRDKEGNIFIFNKIAFDGIASDGKYGALDNNKRDIEWTDNVNILKEDRGNLLELEGWVQVVPNPSSKGEYCMQVNEFKITSHSPDLIIREEFIPSEYIILKERIKPQEVGPSVGPKAKK